MPPTHPAGSDPETIAHLSAELARATAALRDREERLGALLRASADGIVFFSSVRDREGSIEDFRWEALNPAAEAVVSRSAADLVGRRLLEEMPGHRAEGLFDAYRRVVETGERWTGEFEYRHEGLDHAFRTVAEKCGDGLAISFQDVTGRQRLERELRSQRQRMYELFAKAPAFMGVVHGPDHTIEMANEAYYTLLGRPRQLVGLPVAVALPEAAEQGFVALLDRVRETKEPFFGRNLAFVVKGAGEDELEERRVDFVYQPIVDPDGSCSGIFVHGVDVSERVRSAEALQLSEQRFRRMMEHAADVVCVVDRAGILRYTSPSFDRGLGYEDGMLLGQGALELVHPEDLARGQEALARLASGEVPMQSVELRVRDVQGTYRILDIVATSLLDDPAVRGILVTGSDVTAERALEEQLRLAQKMEAVGKLAGGVAHDFNNLLTVIDAHSAFLMESTAPGEQRHEDANEIRKAAQRAARLTRQLLAFSRKQLLAPRVIDLNATIADLGAMLGRLIGEDIEMRLKLEPGLGPVLVDPGQVEQVLVNLVVNARDAMPGGGRVTVTTSNCTVPPSGAREYPDLAPGDWVLLCVRDTGQGMSAEVQAQVFEPFFTTKPSGMGTGLGLSTVYGIVRQSGGAIWCGSRAGRGTTFTVALPRVDAVATPPAEVAREPLPGSETVLLVEDEPAVRALASRVLTRQGYRVLEAGDGQEALRVAAAHDGIIDLVITDSVMPRMGGAEMACELQLVRPDTQMLFMSGYTDDEMVRRGIAADPSAFLQKPFTAQELARRVREVLDERLTFQTGEFRGPSAAGGR